MIGGDLTFFFVLFVIVVNLEVVKQNHSSLR